MSKLAQIVEGLKIVGGGAGAGYLDTKFQDKKVAGQGLGTVVAIAGIAAGLSLKSRLGKHAADIGWGAAAFEAGKFAQNKTLGVSGVRGYPGVRGFGAVRGVGALPPSQRPLSQGELDMMFAHAAARRVA